jgi:hypothetical protein
LHPDELPLPYLDFHAVKLYSINNSDKNNLNLGGNLLRKEQSILEGNVPAIEAQMLLKL